MIIEIAVLFLFGSSSWSFGFRIQYIASENHIIPIFIKCIANVDGVECLCAEAGVPTLRRAHRITDVGLPVLVRESRRLFRI